MKDKVFANVNLENPHIYTALTQAAEQCGMTINQDSFKVTEDVLTKNRQKIGAVLQNISISAGDTQICFAVGGLSVDARERRLVDQAGEVFGLTDLELAMLLYLYKASGAAVSKERFLKDVWKYQKGVTTHTVETHIYRLRQKIPALSEHLVTTDDGYVLK